ncbi:hypothetical protein FQR65_LT19175 [Abscondita terminalis]|nr:hypothetical protein FQR65_LT19175 [Abscondita terminalis]
MIQRRISPSGHETRCCMAVVSSCRELPACHGGDSKQTACASSEEGGDDVKSSWPLRPGLHTCYNGRYSGQLHSNVMPISESRSQFGLRSATRPHEVGFASNRVSAMTR